MSCCVSKKALLGLSLICISLTACSAGPGIVGSTQKKPASKFPTSSSQVSLSSLTVSNTSACPASGALPSWCQQPFTGQVDTRSGVATPKFDPPTGNVSDEDIHGYLSQGSNTKIFANFMLGYCTTTSSTYCNNNVQTGYISDDANTIAAQVQDLKRRQIDGAVMTWQGAGTNEDKATLLYQSYVDSNDCSGPQACSPMYMIMYDGASMNYNVLSTGIPGTSGASCAGQTGMSFENCVVEHMRNDMCYMNGTHWGNDAYQKANGRPILEIFPVEDVIPATGPAPSWSDVWSQIESWNSDLPENCGFAPYNASNGIPLIIFENNGGFSHQDSSGSFYWVEPAGTDPNTDQYTLNISPVTQGGTLDNFFATAAEYTGEQVWGNSFKGFNSSQANWGTGRIMDQECGQTWIDSLTESNSAYTAGSLSYLQIATWNDYNEGTEIETGINNCYSVSANVNGNTLSWSLIPSNINYASLSTVSHIEIYDQTSGQDVTLMATQPAATSGTYNLHKLSHGHHTLYVRMVGKNSILNQMSAGVPYSN